VNRVTIPYQTGTLVVLGDLHFDSYQRHGIDTIKTLGFEDILWEADALILAGDLTNGPARNWADVFQYLSSFSSPQRIYALPGNHDYYHGDLDSDPHLADATRTAGAQFVQKQVLLHGDTRLPCCTLWTDFALSGSVTCAMRVAGRVMRDYDLIRAPEDPQLFLAKDGTIRPPRRIRPIDTLNAHLDHRAWLETAFAAPHPAGAAGRTVVVTHHGPHLAVAGRIDGLTASFHSDLSDLLKRFRPEARIFVHSHRRLLAPTLGIDVRNVSIGCAGELIDEPISYLREACVWKSLRTEDQ